ncbi:hypothetical protein FACS1894133_2580 [Clostridia bacterium]|nr:hypothetical protein FACS1894133_2580 [Clostridia bacterium]
MCIGTIFGVVVGFAKIILAAKAVANVTVVVAKAISNKRK